MSKGRVAATAAAVCCAAVGGGVAVAAGGDPPNPIPPFTPENQAAPDDVAAFCAVPPRGTFPVSRTIRGRGPSGGREVTELGPAGMYRVSRCDDSGALTVSKTMGPIPVPGGKSAIVPLQEITPTNGGGLKGIAATYGSPEDARWAARWHEVGDDVVARAFPITPPEREVK